VDVDVDVDGERVVGWVVLVDMLCLDWYSGVGVRWMEVVDGGVAVL